MLANTLKDRVRIQVKTSTLGATGMTVVWKPAEIRYVRIIPLDANTRATYQQMKSEVTHRIVLRGSVTLNADYRFLWGDKTLIPVGPPQKLGNSTVIMVKED